MDPPKAKPPKPKHQRIIDLLRAEDLTVRQTAERLGISLSTIQYACSKYNVKYVSANDRNRIPQLMDRDWLYQKVTVEGLTYQEVGDLVSCSRQYVQQRVAIFDIPRAGDAGPADPDKLAGRSAM